MVSPSREEVVKTLTLGFLIGLIEICRALWGGKMTQGMLGKQISEAKHTR